MAGTATQLLPKNELFEKPDWTAATAGSAQDHCLPWYFFYASWNLSNSLDTADSEYASCPFKTNGALECRNFGVLYAPDAASSGSDFGVLCTDKHAEAQTKMRGFVCREEDTFNRDDLSVEVEFGLATVGTALLGSSQGGTNGSSPGRNGSISFPTTDVSGSTSEENTTLNFNSSGNTAGQVDVVDPIKVPGGDGWLGNAVAVRVGGGRPTLANSGSSASSSSSWSWRRIDAYVFAVYPVKVSTSRVDLRMEMWRFNTNSSDKVIPRLLAKHTVENGAQNLKRDRPYRLRVEVENVSGNPTLKGYVSDYQQGGSTSEVQAFKSGVFTLTNTIADGPSGDGSANTSTGVITDSGSSKISAFADKTVGVFMGRDRTLDVNPYTIGSAVETLNVLEGLYRVTARSISPDAVIFNDRFERTPTIQTGGANTDELIQGIFSYGWNRMGMFQLDVATENGFGSGISKLRRSLRWTDSATTLTNPTDYVTHMYDADPTNDGSVVGVPRFLWHRRPSTYLFNHHRIAKFKGAVDPSSSTGTAQTFTIGVSSRGSVSQYTHNVIVAYAVYTTDGNGSQTSLTLRISRWFGTFISGVTGSFEQKLAEKVVHSSGSPPSGYDVGGRSTATTHTMGLRVQKSDEGGAEYTMSWDGTNVTFDTFFDDCVQDGTSKVVFHPAPFPTTLQGRTEGMVFVSSLPKSVSGTTQYDDPYWEDWTEGTVDPDDGLTEGATIAVAGEGTPTVNLKTVIDVDWTLEVDVQRPKYTAAFASGHRYTSPIFGEARRMIVARAQNVPKAKFDAILGFFNDRKGVTDPFFFDFPIPSALGQNTLTTISVVFTSSGLKVTRKAEGVYSIELEMVEVFT